MGWPPRAWPRMNVTPGVWSGLAAVRLAVVQVLLLLLVQPPLKLLSCQPLVGVAVQR